MKDWLWYALGGVALLGGGVILFLTERKKSVPLSALTQQASLSGVTSLSAAGAAGTQEGNTIGTVAGAIPVAGGPLKALLGVFLTGHFAREKEAQNENQAINALVPAFDSDLQATFAAANSGEITPAEAIQACQTIWNNYWQGIAPVQQGGKGNVTPLSTIETGNPAGVNGGSFGIMCNSQAPPGGVPCNDSCTAGCCVGNDVLTPTIQQAIRAFSAPNGGTITACKVYSSKYGATTRNAYQLTFTPPSSIPLAAAHLV
jgi:hypothetical protein